MEPTHATPNTDFDHRDVADAVVASVDRTLRQLAAGIDGTQLSAEIRTELTQLASATESPDTDFALRACDLLGVALALEDEIDDRIDDLVATIVSLVPLVPEFGRDNLAASTRRLLAAASTVSDEDLAAGEYTIDLFFAAANAAALAITA